MRRAKAIGAGLTALAVTLAVASAATGDKEPAQAWVHDAMHASTDVSYEGTVEDVRIGDERSEAAVYRIEHRAPDYTKRVYLAPPSLQGDELISKGDTNYWVDARHHRAIEAHNAAINDTTALSDAYTLLRANYRAVVRDDSSLDGRSVADVSLVSKHTRSTMMTVAIDERTKLVLDRQRFSNGGSMASEMRFESIRYVRQLPLSDFDIPKGDTIVQAGQTVAPTNDLRRLVRAAGFDVRQPRFLPDGFAAVDGRIAHLDGVATVHLLYSDGIRTVSLFEHTGNAILDWSHLQTHPVTVAGRQGKYVEEGPTTMLVWQSGNLRCMLVGEMRLADLERIAASIQP